MKSALIYLAAFLILLLRLLGALGYIPRILEAALR